MASPSASQEELVVYPEPHRWVVVHARPRCEKKLAEAARQNGIRAYLPIYVRTHRYGGRTRRFSSPLFTGYLFCCGDLMQQQWLRQNHHAANVLAVFDQERLVDQLRRVRAAVESGLLVEVMPFLEAGRPVRIAAGPMRGSEGVVVRIHGTDRVLLSVDIIQQAVVVEVDSSALTPL